MKTIHFLRTHILLFAAMLVAGVMMSFGTDSGPKKSDKAAVVHYYVSNDMSAGAFRTAANWSTTDNSVPCIEEEEENVRPCKITVQDGTSLSTVLAGKSNPQVLAISEGYKPEP